MNSHDGVNVFEDLSGTLASSTNNPYDALIETCNSDPARIQSRYEVHRQMRNNQQRAKLLAPDFSGVVIDPILEKLVYQSQHPGYVDPRHCLVFWARPPEAIRALVSIVQQKLRQSAPDLWLMPLDCLHLTALEIAHSLTRDEIQEFVDTMQSKIPEITNYTLDHRARLVKPMLSYDGAAVALSFLPAAGEGLAPPGDSYTYHHLRRDLYGLCTSTGVKVASRYTVPSSHLTLARFITREGGERGDPECDRVDMKAWVETLDATNLWLREKYWSRDGLVVKEGGEWTVGQEKGLDCRKGTLWYGGGETVRLGQGF